MQQVIFEQVEPFTLGDVAAQVPAVSVQLIKRVLAQLKKEGRVRVSGRGRGATWKLLE